MVNPNNNLLKIGLTHGDFNGISYEVMMKALNDKRMLELFTPIIYGSSKIASYYRKMLDLTDVNLNLIKKVDYANPKRANIINVTNEEIKIETGKISQAAGEMAYLALEKAIDDLKWDKLDALVTLPISKSNIQSEKFNYRGHTDYLAEKFSVENYLMLMVSENLRVGMITGHIPLSEVPGKINEELILQMIRVMELSLKQDFNIRRPKIAVLGLNPHAGDNGLIGSEENEIIKPAIQKANDENILTFGPYPADSFFASTNYRNFDGILAMYHDQGMTPFKSLAFESGVNFTAGLPIIRTSPAHGTAFDIAGKNIASPDSLMQAIFLAIDINRNRKEYAEITKNPLPVSTQEQKDVIRETEQNDNSHSQ